MDKPNTVCLPYYYDFIIEDNVIYFSMANYNAMCRGNLFDDQVEIIEIFPDATANRRFAYSGMYKYKDDLIFFPYKSDSHDIIIYNISQKKFSRVPCDKNIFAYSITTFEKNDYIYSLSCITDSIYKIDLKKCYMECITGAYSEDNALIGEHICIDDCLYTPLNQKRVMMIFDLEKEEFQYCEYPENILSISTLCYYDGNLWITGEDRRIYVWDLKNKTAHSCVEFPKSVHKFYSGKNWFGNSFIHQGVLWLFPDCANTILKYNILNGEFEELAIVGEEENEDILKEERFFVSKYIMVKVIEKSVFFLSSKTRILYELDLETNNIKKHFLQVDNIYRDKIYPPPVNGRMSEENYISGLEALLNYIGNEDNKTTIIKEVAGRKIYDYINTEVTR